MITLQGGCIQLFCNLLIIVKYFLYLLSTHHTSLFLKDFLIAAGAVLLLYPN